MGNEANMIVYYFFAFAFFCAVLYLIISSATRGNKILSEAKRQTALLNEIAKASGVNPDAVDAIHKIQDKADNA